MEFFSAKTMYASAALVVYYCLWCIINSELPSGMDALLLVNVIGLNYIEMVHLCLDASMTPGLYSLTKRVKM